MFTDVYKCYRFNGSNCNCSMLLELIENWEFIFMIIINVCVANERVQKMQESWMYERII